MKRYAVESLLRPLVEVPTAMVSLSAAIAIACAPDLFWVPSDGTWSSFPLGQWLVVGGLLVNAARRSWDAYRLVNYRKAVSVGVPYALNGDNIPQRPDALFLGKAFRWRDVHARRLAETSREHARPYIKEAPNSKESGNPAIHGVGSFENTAEHALWLSDADRMGHILVVGTTGVGKTRFAELLINQDIRGGGPVIVLDPKGDKELMLQMYLTALACGRGDEFMCFHLAFPELSARYNIFGNYARVTEIAGRIREGLPDQGQSATFAEFVWSYVNGIAVATHALGRRMTIKQLLHDAQDIEGLVAEYMAMLLDTHAGAWRATHPDNMADVAKRQQKGQLPRAQADRKPDTIAMVETVLRLKIADDIGERLLKAFSYDRSYHDKLVASLFPLLQKMSTGAIESILSPDYDDTTDARPVLDFETAIRMNQIVYIGLDSLTDTVVAKTVGAAMFADIKSLGGRIYNFGADQGLGQSGVKRRHARIRLHADEFAEIVGPAFVQILNKLRGAGFDITAYTQSRADVQVGLGDAARAAQAEDNFNTLVMMRVRSEETAEMLTGQMPEILVPTLTWDSGASDSGTGGIGFTSNVKQRIGEERTQLVTPSNLFNLPRGQAFISTQGGRIFKVIFPMPSPPHVANAPKTVPEMAARLIQRYQSVGSEPWRALDAPWRAKLKETAE